MLKRVNSGSQNTYFRNKRRVGSTNKKMKKDKRIATSFDTFYINSSDINDFCKRAYKFANIYNTKRATIQQKSRHTVKLLVK